MRKGQTAMEYLMTYGWAILIIIVVVAALYSLGVFSVKSGVACSPCFGYFAFRDYDEGTVTGGVPDDNGILYLRNGPRTITLDATGTAALVVAPDCATTGGTTTCAPGVEVTLSGVSNAPGTDTAISISYTDTTVVHIDTATIHNP